MKKILIAEDDADARRLLASLMSDLGFHVAEASTELTTRVHESVGNGNHL